MADDGSRDIPGEPAEESGLFLRRRLLEELSKPVFERFAERLEPGEEQGILDAVAQPGATVAEVARRYGIDRRVLRRWKQELAVVTAPTFVTVQITDATLSGVTPAVEAVS